MKKAEGQSDRGSDGVLRVRLREWERFPSETGAILTDIVLPEDAHTRTLIQALALQNKLTIMEYRHGLTIEATSFVGRIRIGALDITIQPKIPRLPLMSLLRYAYGLRHLSPFAPTAFKAATQTFQDLLIQQLAGEVEDLLARGLRREYVRRDANLSTPSGRINIGALARSGGVTRAALPCTFYERQEDTLLNRVLGTGLSLAARMTTDVALRARTRRLGGILGDLVTSLRLNGHTLSEANRTMNRLTAHYQPALDLIALLYENQGLTLDGETAQITLPGFLFDMNRFFQTLLSRFLSENLPDYRLEDEHRLQEVFRYSPQHNPRKQRAPTPRPDYAIWKGAGLVAILDAKYRDLWRTSLPPEWLYQLAIYALSQPTARMATILYPTMEAAATEARIDIRDPVHGQSDARVILRPVPMERLAALVASTSVAAHRERLALASWMAFGHAN